MDRLTIVIPCFNEAESLRQLHTALQETTAQIKDCVFTYLFVNDGSKDNTLGVLRVLAQNDKKVNYLSFTRNFGKEAAMLAGLDYAQADAVIIMDADLQHPPALIPEMLSYWRQGYDDVCAKRHDRKDESFLKRHLTNCFYKAMQLFNKVEVQRDVGDFRLLDKRCVAAIRLLREEQRYTKGLFTWVGYKKKEIPFKVQPRIAGKTTWNFLALSNLAIEGITSFTTAPLRLTTMLGLAVSLLAIIYMFIVLVNALLYGDPVAGYPTLITVVLFLGGVQLLSLGIIGEYLGRVFNESKRRPVYLVDEYNGIKVDYLSMPDSLERRITPTTIKNKEVPFAKK